MDDVCVVAGGLDCWSDERVVRVDGREEKGKVGVMGWCSSNRR